MLGNQLVWLTSRVKDLRNFKSKQESGSRHRGDCGSRATDLAEFTACLGCAWWFCKMLGLERTLVVPSFYKWRSWGAEHGSTAASWVSDRVWTLDLVLLQAVENKEKSPLRYCCFSTTNRSHSVSPDLQTFYLPCERNFDPRHPYSRCQCISFLVPPRLLSLLQEKQGMCG